MSGEAGAPTIAEALEEMDSGVTVSGGAMAVSGTVADATTEVSALSLDGQSLPLRDSGAVRSVNGQTGDGHGNVRITNVETANNLVADDAQSNLDTFAIRTSGGSTSIADGKAWLARLRGHLEHTGEVAEVLTCEIHAEPREEGEAAITAAIDPAAFKAAVTDSDVITLSYESGWSANPELIGVTVTGQPLNGDEIVITYVKADRGTITPATPTAFKSTGWNLYSHASGYARVVKYSDQYGFRVGGAYTGLAYSQTLNGARTPIAPAGGNFNIPGDGYVWVTGGNAASTCIYMTWSNWTDGYEGSFAPYAETVIDLSELMAEAFPDGLLAVGAVADEIDLALQRATSAVEKLTYSEETIAQLEREGRAWEADTEAIYAVRQTPVTHDISIANQYTVSDHGLEFFAGTDAPVEAVTLYGQNLRDKLRTDVLTISQQLLTSQQMAQVLLNLGLKAATGTAAGLMSAGDKTKLDGIAAGAQVNSITGVKGAAENAYRTGNVNLTAAHIGALGAGSLAAVTDANDTTLYGTRLLNAGECAHLPTDTAGVFYQVAFMGTYQRAATFSATGVTRTYERYFANNQWYPWVRVDGIDALYAADVVNSLTGTAEDKPLAAAQGKALLDILNARINSAAGGSNYSTLAEAAAAMFSAMEDGTVRIGRFTRGTAFAYFAMRNSANYSAMLAFTYGSAKLYIILKANTNVTVYSLTGTAE
jgi:hypothetical protein